METLTHWKKNNDSRYISGEDLLNGELLGHGGVAHQAVVGVERPVRDVVVRADRDGFPRPVPPCVPVQGVPGADHQHVVRAPER